MAVFGAKAIDAQLAQTFWVKSPAKPPEELTYCIDHYESGSKRLSAFSQTRRHHPPLSGFD
jgi:hypothetical protein